MANTDATPSWSGYIFQGEVALCRTIELINILGDDIPDSYCLRLEMDEDFSLKTTDIEVFQVKAYLSKDCHKVSKYTSTIQELIDKYYYSMTRTKDPNDGRKTIRTYSDKKRKNPIKSYLITDRNVIDFDASLANFDIKYREMDAGYFNLIHGAYTLENISKKLFEAIKVLLNNPQLTDTDIAAKRDHCCNLIFNKVKERHQTKRAEPISLITIKNWVKDAPNALTEQDCWYNIYKIFMRSLNQGLDLYDLENADDAKLHNVITNAIGEIEKISYGDFIRIIDQFLVPHKELDSKNLLYSFGRYIDENVVRSVVLKAIKEIKIAPPFSTLQYYREVGGSPTRYQLLIHNDEYNENDGAEKILFQKHCEKIFSKPNTKDIDYFITHTLNKDQASVRDRLHHIIEKDEDTTILDSGKNKIFGFKSITNTIIELNDENPLV